MRIGALFDTSRRRLAAAGIEAADLEAAFLLGHVLKKSRAALLLRRNEEIHPAQQAAIESALIRRLGREPLAYILGEQEFWSRPFEVSPAVLIPRPETERIIEFVQELYPERCQSYTFLDLGTGSGILAIILALEFPNAKVVAVDRSATALAVAARNATRHRVEGRIRFMQGDWLQAVAAEGGFDLVVSNPPYIEERVLAGLQPEVIGHEPRSALNGGEEGMEHIRVIAAQAAAVLKSGSWILLEIGADQEERVLQCFVSVDKYDRVEVRPDYAGLPRVLLARRLQSNG